MAEVDTQRWRFPRIKVIIFPLLLVFNTLVCVVWGYAAAVLVFGVLSVLNLLYVLYVRPPKYDAQIIVERVGEKYIFGLELDMDPMEMAKQKTLLFEVILKPEVLDSQG